jgi:predicted MFS family arabinose efflux permease
MTGFVLGLVVVLCLVGGLFYGYTYLKAKVNKTGVSEELLKSASDVINKKPE